MKKSPKPGIVIAELSEKQRKKTKLKQGYYLLQLIPHLSLKVLGDQLSIKRAWQLIRECH